MSDNFNAGIDSSDVVLSFAEEANWGEAPAAAFQAVRMTGEGFMEKKQRSRPEEINPSGTASHAVTQSVAAEGSLNLAFSYGTYDALLAGALNGDWADFAAEDTLGEFAVSVTLGTGTQHGFKATTGTPFADVVVGQWVRSRGFATAGNNGDFRVIAKPDSKTIIVAGTPLVAEAAAGSASARALYGSVLRNGVVIHSYTFQKQLAAALFLLYKGCYVNDMNLQANLGNYMEGSFGFLAKDESKATTNASTGAVTAAPTGRVVDTVAGFRKLEVNGAAIEACTQGIEVNLTKNNARAQYGLGDAAAQGMARGTIEVSGKLSVYFKDFDLYDMYKAETDQLISFLASDDNGDAYMITLPAATLMNPQVVAGGPDTDVVSEFELEGNPGTGIYANVVLQLDKLPAVMPA